VRDLPIGKVENAAYFSARRSSDLALVGDAVRVRRHFRKRGTGLVNWAAQFAVGKVAPTRRPLLGEQRKTYTQFEFFRF
jgi:hypothetical protein